MGCRAGRTAASRGGRSARDPLFRVNQLLYDGLQLLQHRGQDAAGIVTMDGSMFHMHKGMGMVRDVFRTRDMRNLIGNIGIAHVRYPTAGSAASPAEAQPFYVNSPFGIVLGHNGNLTNTEALQQELFMDDLRHVNTGSDSEVLLNVLAHELQEAVQGHRLKVDDVFTAVAGVHRRCKGAYAVVAMIAGFGLLAFRDPNGIRPLVIGRMDTPEGRNGSWPRKASPSRPWATRWCATSRRARRFSSSARRIIQPQLRQVQRFTPVFSNTSISPARIR
jgi:amidophosphoribosyltransferase